MAGNVLTPLDGSRLGEAALPFASAIADRAGWDLHLVNIHVPDPRDRKVGYPIPSVRLERNPPVANPALAARRAYLEATARRHGFRADSFEALRMERGGIPQTIRRHAEGIGSELIVMGTHARTGLERLWLGSVADAVTRLTHIPVLLVRDGQDGHPSPGLTRVRRVLVPLDTTALAERILEPVLELGALLDWTVFLLHVVPTRIVFGSRSYPLLAGDVMDRHRRGTEYLRSVAARFRERGIEVEIGVLENEDPTRTIIRVADEQEMDLVAMASHGRGGLTRAILGSVADGVLSASRLPMLVGGGGTLH